MFFLTMLGAFFYLAGIIGAFIAMFGFNNDKWTAIYFAILIGGGLEMLVAFAFDM